MSEPTTWPEAGHSLVRWRVARIHADGPDADTAPEWVPAEGTEATLVPSITGWLTYSGDDGLITVTVEPVQGKFDANGYLRKADGRVVSIAATDDPRMSAMGWTWRAEVRGKNPVVFAAPSGGIVDISEFVLAPAVDETRDWVGRIPELIDAAGGLVSIASITTDGPDIVITLSNGSEGGRFPIPEGTPGPSAYDLAVDAGFSGDVAAWLASLRGEDSTVPGPPNTLTIGDVTGGAVAGASITGDAPDQTLHLTLPRGDDARPRYTALTAVSEGRTVTEADEGALLEVISATPVTITLPESFPLGGVVDVVQASEGSVTLAGTVLCSGQPVTRAQGSVVTCVKRASGWLVAGDVVT